MTLEEEIQKFDSLDSEALSKNTQEYFSALWDNFKFVWEGIQLVKSQNISEIESIIPFAIRTEVGSALNSIRFSMERIAKFHPKDIRDPAGNQLQISVDQFANDFVREFNNKPNNSPNSKSNLDRIAFINDHLLHPARLVSLSNKIPDAYLDEFKKQSTLVENQIKQNFKESQSLMESLKEAGSSLGAEQFRSVFDGQSEEYNRSATWWLRLSILISILSGLLILCLDLDLIGNVLNFLAKCWQIDFSYKPAPKDALIYQLSNRFFVTSFLTFVTFQIIKSFNANRHQYMMNKHRANCLKVFDIFHKSGFDDRTKDIILIQATKSIFEAGDSGFISTKHSAHGGDIEITRIPDIHSPLKES